MEEKNNRMAYVLITVVSLIAVYFTKQWLDSQKEIPNDPYVPAPELKFDPATYVDPYGKTTCYPSDVKRMEKERMKKSGNKTTTERGKYHYHVNLSNVHREWESYDSETLADGSVRLKKKSSDLSYLNGTYDWDMDLYLANDDEILSYIIENYATLKKYKVSEGMTNIYDRYNDNLDEYQDDPEDEITFDPDTYYFLDD